MRARFYFFNVTFITGMAKTRSQKEHEREELERKLKAAKSVIFASFSGLSVFEQDAFRKECRNAGVEVRMIKKTLSRIAFKNTGITIGEDEFSGNTIFSFSVEDEVAPARMTAKFAKFFHDRLVIRGGVLNKKVITKERAVALAGLPSRNELRAQLIGAVNAPLYGFVNAMRCNVSRIVSVLQAMKEAKT